MPDVDVVITIRATVPISMLSHMFEGAKNIAPVSGILSFEMDGSNVEIGSQS